MTKLAELKAAYAASTQGEWSHQEGNTYFDKMGNTMTADMISAADMRWIGAVWQDEIGLREQKGNGAFIALAHNNMAALLEAAVELGRFVEYLGVAGCDGAYDREIERAVNLLENLK